MHLTQFSLKKANASTQLANFDRQPSWQDLVTQISPLFIISPDDVIVSYINKDREIITLHNEEQLQRFYKSLGPSSETIKFVVQDIKVYSKRSSAPPPPILTLNQRQSLQLGRRIRAYPRAPFQPLQSASAHRQWRRIIM